MNQGNFGNYGNFGATGFYGASMAQQESPQNILNDIMSIQNSVMSDGYQKFMRRLFEEFITNSISDKHRFNKNIYKKLSYLPGTQDELSIVICIEINEQLRTVKHNVLRLEDAIRHQMVYEELDDSVVSKFPFVATQKTTLKIDISINEFMYNLNQLVERVGDYAIAYSNACGNYDLTNDELSKYEFNFGGIVVRPLFISDGSILYQYAFSRYLCQALKGDAMFAYVERNL